MTQEDEDLLLKDLCARLPYGVILSVTLKDKYDDIVNRNIELTEYNLGYITKASNWQKYKPYLRPMSSMTEEESNEYRMFIDYSYNDFTSESTPCVYIDKINEYLDWLNVHHFDYRGLIDKGLAIEAPEGMYNY